MFSVTAHHAPVARCCHCAVRLDLLRTSDTQNDDSGGCFGTFSSGIHFPTVLRQSSHWLALAGAATAAAAGGGPQCGPHREGLRNRLSGPVVDDGGRMPSERHGVRSKQCPGQRTKLGKVYRKSSTHAMHNFILNNKWPDRGKTHYRALLCGMAAACANLPAIMYACLQTTVRVWATKQKAGTGVVWVLPPPTGFGLQRCLLASFTHSLLAHCHSLL